MEIGNSFSNRPQFKAVNISKNTKKILDSRGELEEFNKFLPELERKGKKADITFYAVNRMRNGIPTVAYGMSIRPLNRLKDNVVTKFLGLAKNKQGDSYIEINNRRATENIFRGLYNSAYSSRNYKGKLEYQNL